MNTLLDLIPARDDATEEARALLAAIFDEVGMPVDARRLLSLPGDLRAKGGEWWILSLRSVVAGAVGLSPGPSEGEAALCWWGVVRARRGMGLGKWMAEFAIRHARLDMGRQRLRADVTPAMRRAACLLIDLGFRAPEDSFDPETFDKPTPLTMAL